MTPPPSPLDFLDAALADLDARGLLRATAEPEDASGVSFCSNDYLGLAHLPPPPAPAGAGASRLIAGERVEHQALERELAAFFGAEAALLFASGYAANLGALSALLGPEDLVVSDELNHASIIDGVRLARSVPVVVPHGDVAAVEAALARKRHGQRAWVLVESYYSMDGDSPDLAALRRLCDASGAALYVDEAHAVGVLGPGGRGVGAAADVRADVLVGTLGKSLGAQGAFVVGTSKLRSWLWNRARSFVFSTGLSPSMAAAGRRGLDVVRDEPARAERVLLLAERLRAGLAEAGADRVARLGGEPPARPLVLGYGHVVPVVVGTERRALALAELLRDAGIGVRAVRPPTVPAGTARVRLTVTAKHADGDIERAVRAFAQALPRLADLR